MCVKKSSLNSKYQSCLAVDIFLLLQKNPLKNSIEFACAKKNYIHQIDFMYPVYVTVHCKHNVTLFKPDNSDIFYLFVFCLFFFNNNNSLVNFNCHFHWLILDSHEFVSCHKRSYRF